MKIKERPTQKVLVAHCQMLVVISSSGLKSFSPQAKIFRTIPAKKIRPTSCICPMENSTSDKIVITLDLIEMPRNKSSLTKGLVGRFKVGRVKPSAPYQTSSLSLQSRPLGGMFLPKKQFLLPLGLKDPHLPGHHLHHSRAQEVDLYDHGEIRPKDLLREDDVGVGH